MNHTKSHIRKTYRALRLALTANEQQALSENLFRQFETIPLPAVQVIMSYQPIKHQFEFDPVGIEQSLLNQNPNAILCYPKVHGNAMDVFKFIPQHSTWETNEWGIPEISGGEKVMPEQIDLIIVPLLIFDRKGFRVGYGKGYYDRFLQQCRSNVLSVGCSFFEPVEAITDLHAWDMRIRYGITPEKVYEF